MFLIRPKPSDFVAVDVDVDVDSDVDVDVRSRGLSMYRYVFSEIYIIGYCRILLRWVTNLRVPRKQPMKRTLMMTKAKDRKRTLRQSRRKLIG